MAPLPPSRSAQISADHGLPQSRTERNLVKSHTQSGKVTSPVSTNTQSSSNDPQFKPIKFSPVKPSGSDSSNQLSPRTIEKDKYHIEEITQRSGNGEIRQNYTLQTLSAFTGMVIEKLRSEPLSLTGAPSTGGIDKSSSSIPNENETQHLDREKPVSEKPLRPGSRLNLKV